MTAFRPPARHNGGPPLDAATTGQAGYIKVYRAMRVHDIVGFGMQVDPADPERKFCFSRAEAWQDMIMECRYRDGFVVNGGRRMEIRSGELLGATSWLATRWNWTPKTVRSFLDRLENHGMIEQTTPGVHPLADEVRPDPDQSFIGNKKGQQKGQQARVLTVCNYPVYQSSEDAEGPAKGQIEGQLGASSGPAKGNTLRREEGKKERKEEDIPKREYVLSHSHLPNGDGDATFPKQFSTLVVPAPRPAPIETPPLPTPADIRVVSGELQLEDGSPAEPDKPDDKAKGGITAADALIAFEAFNSLAQRIGLPLARSMTPARRKALQARLREHGGLSGWGIILANVERSAFLRGKNNRGWRADLDFLLQTRSCSKVADGTYGNGAHGDTIEPDETQTQRIMRKMAEQSARMRTATDPEQLT